MGFFSRLLGGTDKDDFAQLCIKALRRGGEQRTIEYDAEEFRLTIEGGLQIFLGNLYAEYLATPRHEREGLLARVCGLANAQADADFGREVAQAKLLPRVQARFYHEVLRLNGLSRSDVEAPIPMSTRPLNEHLAVELVIDMPDMFAMVSPEQLERWGFTFEQAMEVGRENLWKLSTKSFEQVAPGLYVSSAGDAHDASRMILHDLVRRHQVKGQHVAIPVNRSLLLVSGSEDQEALARMITIAEQELQQPRGITGVAFALHETTWKPFLPPRQSSLYEPFHDLAARSILADYAQQKEMLDKIFEKRGQDIFVASAMYVKHPDGSVMTMSSWAHGVETLLPQSEFIVFGVRGRDGKPQPVGYGKWERVLQVVGTLMQQTEDYPPRFHVRQFPTEEQLRAMDLTPM